MNFTVPQKELSAALARCAAIAPDKSSLPVLSNVRLDPRAGCLHLEATDLEVGYHTAIFGLIWNGDMPETVAPFLLPAKKLHDIIKAIPVGEVAFAVVDNVAVITGGTVTFTLTGLDALDFPFIPVIIAGGGLPFVPAQLAGALKHVAYCYSRDEDKPNLNGCLLQLETNDEGNLFAVSVATDGHRLCVSTECIDEGEDVPERTEDIPAGLLKGIIIPAKGIAELLKLSAIDPGTISLNSNMLIISLGDECLSIRLVEGDFPDYNRVIPPNPVHFVQLKRQALVDALERCRIITNRDSRKVELSIEGDSLTIASSLPLIGAQASDRVTVEVIGEPPACCFNVEYLLQALTNISSSQVELCITNEMSPTIIRPANSDWLQAIIMPMRGA